MEIMNFTATSKGIKLFIEVEEDFPLNIKTY
jgi:hypothetical protein